MNQSLVPKVFTDLAQRYAERPGGYTRIHKYGNRPGDNAPHAILELVDSPRDLRFAMTARAVGWELLGKKVGQEGPKAVVASGVPEVEEVVAREKEEGWTDLEEGLTTVGKWLSANGAGKDGLVMGDKISFADFQIAGWFACIRNLCGEESEVWKKVTTFDGGRWKAFVDRFSAYATVL